MTWLAKTALSLVIAASLAQPGSARSSAPAKAKPAAAPASRAVKPARAGSPRKRRSSRSASGKAGTAKRQKGVRAGPAPQRAATKGTAGSATGSYESDTGLLRRVYALRDLALNEKMRGDYGLAVKHLMEAAQLSSQYYQKPSANESLLYMDLAGAAEAAGQDDVAGQAYIQCIERASGSAEARMRYSQLLARRGHTEEALSQARQAVASQPANPEAHMLLGLLLEGQGEAAAAAQAKQRARSLLESRPSPAEDGSETRPPSRAGGTKSDTAEPLLAEPEPSLLP